MKNLILLAWRELTIRPLRSLVNVLAVALGVAMVLAADVIGSAARSGTMVADERNLGAVLGELVTLSLTVVSVIILLAAAFLIFNNFAMQITQRRRRIGGMRAAGMTRRQVTVWVMLEASLVAWIGVGLGFIAGPLMGQGIIRLIELLGEATGMTVLVFAQPDPIRSAMIQAACLGWGVALAASLIPAVQAARLTPLEGLRRPAYSVRTKLKNRITYLCLLAIIGVTGWVLIWPPGEWTRPPWNGYFGLGLVILWLALLAVISPWLVGKLGIWGRSAAADLSSGVSRLIPDNLWRARGRVAVTALTIALG
ncbi:MAG: ABC transporter permease, partial [Anaerolineales bacterium]